MGTVTRSRQSRDRSRAPSAAITMTLVVGNVGLIAAAADAVLRYAATLATHGRTVQP